MERVVTYNLSDNFIQNLADFIEKEFLSQGKDISNLAFVFGGKRPSLFLKKELSRRIKKGFFSPRFFSMDEFIEYTLSKKEAFLKISDLDACFALYKLSKELAKDILKGRESFSKFLPWARELLSFIDQLDLENIKADSLKNIQEKAIIGYDVPENINILLSNIISLKKAYQADLEERGLYSRGLMYSLASRYIRDIKFDEFNRIIFCGFFYLHKSEEAIMQNLYQAQKAVFFFQGDEREWSVLKNTSRTFGFSIQPEKIREPEYALTLQAGFDVHSQACLAREAIKKIPQLDKTVIVLPEADSIIPLLSEISGAADDFNVSMGYPLKRSCVYSLFECIFRAQNTKKGDKYYTKDYLKALSHPLVKNLKVFPNPSITRVLAHKIEEALLGIEKNFLGGSLFVSLSDIYDSGELYDAALKTMKGMDIEVSYDELRDAVRQLHSFLFLIWENIGNFCDFSLALGSFLETLLNKSFLASYPLNLKMAQEIFSIREELGNGSFNNEPFTREEIFKIFENKIEAGMISFSGSPLKGLQILGLFETRSLNFENVIIMDANESALPSLRIYEPLIPREVMISLGLNRLEKEEEIQRYHFRRLICGAKNVHLIYQQRDDKEKSRFLQELIWEEQKKRGALDVLLLPKASFKVKVLPKRLEIKKDDAVIRFLKNFEYSASSINTYMHCPLRFYYQYVLGLREKEDSLEEPQERDIGTFIHELLKDAFAGFIGRKPYFDSGFKKEFFASLDKKFSDEFRRKMSSDAFLLKEILDFRMRRFLDNEEMRGIQGILCLEKRFKRNIKLAAGNFKFKAVVDRIDRLNDDSVLVLDYKTGSSDIMPQAAEKIASAGFSREALKNTVKSFQLPLYLYIVAEDERYKNEKINAALYSIRDTDENLGLNCLFKKEEQFAHREKIIDIYLGSLESLLQDILNPDIPFRADEENAYQCRGCPFFYLCR